MRSLLKFALVPFTLAMTLIGCGKSNAPPPTPADVTLNVPGMY